MRAKSAPVEAEDIERSAGFLTNTERQYLVGEWAPGDADPGDWSDSQGRAKRSDIKTRTRHAMADIALLNQHGDYDLLRNVIEIDDSRDDGVPTFYQETLKHAKEGLSEFLIRLALEPDRADELINVLHGEDWDELLSDMSDDVADAKQLAQEHEQFVEPAVERIQTYAKANNLSKSEMMDAIDYHWSE